MDLSGLDVTDGEQVWSHKITDADWTSQHGDLPVSLDEQQSLVVVDGERMIVDLGTGRPTPAAAATVTDGYVCYWSLPWDAPPNAEDGSERSSDRLWFPCDARGEQVPVPTADSIEGLTEPVGDVRLVVGPEQVVAFTD